VPDQARFDVKFLPFKYLAGVDDVHKLGITEGTEVFFTGLFLQNLTDSKNVPIVRFGRVALAPGEPVLWAGVPRDLVLIESMSFGGNSGSPVFFYLGADRVPGSLYVGPPEIKLAGVMMGAFQDLKPITLLQTS